jgi:FixJ family two-component response regulator
MTRAPAVIAVLDDEPQMRKALRRLLTTYGFEVETYESGDAFLASLSSHPADCLVLDLQMPALNGFDVLAALQSRHSATPVVVITAHDEPGTEERVHALGARGFVRKPVDASLLVLAIASAMPEETERD